MKKILFTFLILIVFLQNSLYAYDVPEEKRRLTFTDWHIYYKYHEILYSSYKYEDAEKQIEELKNEYNLTDFEFNEIIDTADREPLMDYEIEMVEELLEAESTTFSPTQKYPSTPEALLSEIAMKHNIKPSMLSTLKIRYQKLYKPKGKNYSWEER